MKKSLLLAVMLACLLSSGFATVIDDFNFTTQAQVDSTYSIGYYDPAVSTLTLSLSTTDKQAGSSAVKATYSWPTNKPWYSAWFTKTLSTPLDMSNAQRFTIWTKGDAWLSDTSSQSIDGTRIMWYIDFYGTSGYCLEYDDWTGTNIQNSAWKQATFYLTDLRENPWAGYGGKPNMNNINRIDINLQVNSYSPGSTNIYFDDFEYFTNSAKVGESLIDNYDFATDSAVKATWQPYNVSAGDAITASLSTTSKNSGTSAVFFNITCADYWMNVQNRKTLPANINIANTSFVKVWMKGDAANISTTANSLWLFFGDTSGSWIRGGNTSPLNSSSWECYDFEFGIDEFNAYYIRGPFAEYDWDPAGQTSVTDLTNINTIGWSYVWNMGANPAAPVNLKFYVDDMSFVYSTTINLIVNPFSLSVRPSSSAVTLNVVSGVAPYTWSLSTVALGTLSATSGASVNYTPGAVTVSGNIIVTDSVGQVTNVPVSITPTSAPMASDAVTYNVIRKDVSANWNLFE